MNLQATPFSWWPSEALHCASAVNADHERSILISIDRELENRFPIRRSEVRNAAWLFVGMSFRI